MSDLFFKREALSNNTFNLDSVERSINDIQMSSFKYLYQVQMDMTEYRRFNFKMSELQRSNTVNHIFSLLPRRWVLYVPDDFIHEGKRLEYRRSKYYEQEITYDDTLNNRALFSYTYLVFIDGKLYCEGVNIYCKEDKTYCVFNLKEKPKDGDGILKSDFDKYMEMDANITVIFMPNYSNVNIETNAYAMRSFNKEEGYPLYKFNDIKPSKNALCFSRSNYTSIGTLTDFDYSEKGIKINTDVIDTLINEHPNDTCLHLNFVDFKHLFQTVSLGTSEDDRWFELPIQDYPVAIDNCFIFDEDGNYMHDLTIDMYYPNIYYVNGDRQGKNLKVYVFYYKSNMLLKHRNALAVYYKYTSDVLERYQRGSTPEKIKNYNPAKIIYNIKDYHGSQYFDDHFKYKVEKMRELTKVDGEYFREYLIKLALKNNYYYIDVAKIDNLDKKIRFDNSDTKNPELVTFDEPMYMFVFSNEFRSKYDELTVVVDGIKHTTDLLFKNDLYDFLYVPISMINPESIIEIEKMKEVIREIEFIPVDGVRTTINIDDKALRNRALLNDIFIVNNETKKYVSIDDYELYSRVGDDMIDVARDDLFLPCPESVEILVTNPDLLGKSLTFHIKKNYRFFQVHTQHGKDNLYPLSFVLDGKNDSRHIRLYRNGKVIPRHIFTCRFPDYYDYAETQLFPGMIREDGDIFIAESLPYKMSQVCYIEKLEAGKIIDLTNMLDKPFDLRWHDVYLNGKKLNRNDIEIISSNKIIIRKTKSLRWLEIVENSRDDEYFGYMPLSDIIDGILDSDDDDGLRDRIEDTITGMEDIEDDIVTEIVTIIDVIMNMFYWDYMVPFYGLINPDHLQIDQKTHDFYHEIMDGEPFLLNADYGRENVYRELWVNPDKEMEDFSR